MEKSIEIMLTPRQHALLLEAYDIYSKKTPDPKKLSAWARGILLDAASALTGRAAP